MSFTGLHSYIIKDTNVKKKKKFSLLILIITKQFHYHKLRLFEQRIIFKYSYLADRQFYVYIEFTLLFKHLESIIFFNTFIQLGYF